MCFHCFQLHVVHLRSLNLPYQLLDADLFARLFVIVKPFPLCQVNAGELGARVDSISQPVALLRSIVSLGSMSTQSSSSSRTSGLNSTNSNPLQSNSNSFCALGGSACS